MEDWFASSLPYLVGLLANIATIAVLASGLLLIQRRLVKKSLCRSRQRAFKNAGSMPIPKPAIESRVDALVEHGPKSVQEEVEWLTSSIAPGGKDDHSLPLRVRRDKLTTIALAYEKHASDLSSRIILSPNQVPIIERCMELSRSTARYLRDLATANPEDGSCLPSPGANVVRIPHRGITLRPYLLPDRARNALAYDLIVSYRAHLTAPSQAEGRWLDTDEFSGLNELPIDEIERASIKRRIETGHIFDGFLPRLIRWERQYDPRTGRPRLHIAIAACSYSAVMLDHYPGEKQVRRLSRSVLKAPHSAKGIRDTRDVAGRQVGLLTLSLVPITRDGYVVLVERSHQTGSHEGFFGPAISGNLELHTRDGIAVDSDAYGIPDPRRALAREAKEEMGLRIDPQDISITGLVGFDSPSEVGTTVLMATCRLPFTLEEVANQSFQADVIEGRWELGSVLLGLRIPRTTQEREAAESWLLNSSDLTAHATAASLAAMATAINVSKVSEIPVQPHATEPRGELIRRLQIS